MNTNWDQQIKYFHDFSVLDWWHWTTQKAWIFGTRQREDTQSGCYFNFQQNRTENEIEIDWGHRLIPIRKHHPSHHRFNGISIFTVLVCWESGTANIWYSPSPIDPLTFTRCRVQMNDNQSLDRQRKDYSMKFPSKNHWDQQMERDKVRTER